MDLVRLWALLSILISGHVGTTGFVDAHPNVWQSTKIQIQPNLHECVINLEQVNEAMPMRDPKDALRMRLIICQRFPLACIDMELRRQRRPEVGQNQCEGNTKISKSAEERTSRRPPGTYKSISQFLFELKHCIVKKLIVCTLPKTG